MIFGLLFCGAMFWCVPVPRGLSEDAWHLFGIFITTIGGLILRPLPIAPVALMGGLAALLTHLVQVEELGQGFGQSSLWLIVFAFFLAKALISSGLASRISQGILSCLGGSLLGVAYSLVFSEFLLAPFVPSLSARSGGILFPIAMDLVEPYRSSKDHRTAQYLLFCALHASVICGALFLTSMAGNPLAVELAGEEGILLTWSGWARVTIVPGLVSLLVTPWVLRYFLAPGEGSFSGAKEQARRRLQAMGAFTREEWITSLTFALVLSLWIAGPLMSMEASSATLLGVVLLFLTRVLSWKDCLREERAWDLLVWLGLLIALGTRLKKLGFFSWLASSLLGFVGEVTSWHWGFLFLCLVYFFARYAFATGIAHITAMYVAFLAAALDLGTPPLLAGYVFGVLGGMAGGLTHYSSNSTAIYFSSGCLPLKTLWQVGALLALVNLAIWGVVGGLWWKFIGVW